MPAAPSSDEDILTNEERREIEQEVADLEKELERFQKEKERVRAIVGSIGGVPRFHSKIANYLIAAVIIACLVLSLWAETAVVQLAMVEVAIAVLSFKLIYVIYQQSRVNHFQLWVLTALEWRMDELFRLLREEQRARQTSAPHAADADSAGDETSGAASQA